MRGHIEIAFRYVPDEGKVWQQKTQIPITIITESKISFAQIMEPRFRKFWESIVLMGALDK